MSGAVRLLPMDLVKQESIQRLEKLLADEHSVVSILVRAAGFGKNLYS